MFGEISAALTVFEKVRNYVKYFSKENEGRLDLATSSEPQTISGRFIRLFEVHGVHRNQIPRFFGHGLTLEDVNDDSKLLGRLDDRTLSDASDLFLVRREWLEGADDHIYTPHDFYKCIDECIKFVDDLKRRDKRGHIFGKLLWEKRDDYNGSAVFIISELAGCIGDRQILRHHICHNFVPGHFKSRAYLTGCISIFKQSGIYIRGERVSPFGLDRISDGLEFIDSNLYARIRVVHPWYPDDMDIDPEVFIDGVDPSHQREGIKSALVYWINMVQSDEVITKDANLALPRFKGYLSRL